MSSLNRNRLCRAVGMLSLVMTVILGVASAQAQTVKINSLPVTPQNLKDWGLTNTLQKSHGLVNTGVGQPLYLETLVSTSYTVTNVAWSLTVPTGSVAVLQSSPITNGVPTYDGGDRNSYKVADRKVLVPDVVCTILKGDYNVMVTVSTMTGILRATNTFYGSKYQGMYGEDGFGCAMCHYKLPTDNTNMTAVEDFALTQHADAFKRKINGEAGAGFKSTCTSCHVLGYDTTAAATNGGFDDVALQTGWVFPTNLATAAATNNWSLMPASLQDKANIQCESCHGPGYTHMQSGGKTNKIGVSLSAGDCGVCHDSMTHHVKNYEWGQTLHATGYVFRAGSCAPCHSTKGYIDTYDPGFRLSDSTKTNFVRGTYNEGVTCAACHDPHSKGMGAYQLRDIPSFTIATNMVVTRGGDGIICMNCHHDRYDAEARVKANGTPHHGTQGDMLFGTNAIQYGLDMPSSRHWDVVPNTCVTCHMQETPASMPTNALNKVGGHTFRIGWDGGTPLDTSDDVHLTEACASCHGELENFNFGGEDYDQDGKVEGVQQEISDMLYELSMLLPPVGSTTIDTTQFMTSSFTNALAISRKKAYYNWYFVTEDGSLGVHNPKYAAALLRASIDDLKGGIDVDHDGLLDSWEMTYFGSLTAQTGSGDKDGDGLSNAQEMAAGTNPNLIDTDGDGVSDYAEMMAGSNPLSGASKPGTNSVYLLPAVELGYIPGTMGVTQQFQSVTTLGITSTWTNLGPSFVSSNAWFYYLDTKRNSTNKFYRVITLP